jgi:hypothetical protein
MKRQIFYLSENKTEKCPIRTKDELTAYAGEVFLAELVFVGQVFVSK